MKKLKLLFVASSISVLSVAQVPKYDSGVINVNQVSAFFTAEGTLNFSKNLPAYFVPTPGNVASIFCGALWIGGLDAGHQLHIAAQTYHQNGTDFWPGPMMDSLNYSPHQDSVWNHVWLIYKSTIDSFRQGKFGSNIPASILNWPGNGNTSLGERGILAPYVDSDHNGYYDPSGGDYPLIRGDEALYTIFNDDRGVAHTETGGKKLGVEVHLMVYQFNSADTTVSETTFIHYDIFNLSKNDYDSVYFGSWIDMDVGNGGDNLIGCDSANNYWYTYDGHSYNTNGSGQYAGEPGYLNAPPAQSLAYMCDTMTHFVYYNNDFTVQGNPTTAGWYYDYMKNVWGDNTHTTYGGTGYGGTANTNYMFSGNPASSTGWSEITANDVSGDRRGISSTGPYSLKSGARKSLDLGLVFSRGQTAYGNIYPVTMLPSRVSDVKSFYNSQSYGCDETMLGVPPVTSKIEHLGISVYPNPANGVFTVVISHPELTSGPQTIEIYNVLGEKVYGEKLQAKSTSLNITGQPSGVYFYRVFTETGNEIGMGKIVKL
jgi:hypothetical protein